MPDSKWKPANIPNIKEDFGGKKREAQSHKMVSKMELEQLLAEREKPVAEPHLTRGGATEYYIHKKHSQIREQRITTIEQRLEEFKNRLKNEFTIKHHQQERTKNR